MKKTQIVKIPKQEQQEKIVEKKKGPSRSRSRSKSSSRERQNPMNKNLIRFECDACVRNIPVKGTKTKKLYKCNVPRCKKFYCRSHLDEIVKSKLICHPTESKDSFRDCVKCTICKNGHIRGLRFDDKFQLNFIHKIYQYINSFHQIQYVQ